MTSSAAVSAIRTALWVLASVTVGGAADSDRSGGFSLNLLGRLPSVASIPLARSSDSLPLFPPLGTPPPPVFTEIITEVRRVPVRPVPVRPDTSDLSRRRGLALGAARQRGNEIDDRLKPIPPPPSPPTRPSPPPPSPSPPEPTQQEPTVPTVSGHPFFAAAAWESSRGSPDRGSRPFRPSRRVLESEEELSGAVAVIAAPDERAARRRKVIEARARLRRPEPPVEEIQHLRQIPQASRRSSRLDNFRPSPRVGEGTFRPTGPRGLRPHRSGPLPFES